MPNFTRMLSSKFNMQKFQNIEHSNSRTFQGHSRAWNFFQNSRTFKDFQGLLKDPMNPVYYSSTSTCISNFVEIRKALSGWTDRRTYGLRTLRPALLHVGRLGGNCHFNIFSHSNFTYKSAIEYKPSRRRSYLFIHLSLMHNNLLSCGTQAAWRLQC